MSVEQLEQVMGELVCEVVRWRGEWDKEALVRALERKLREVKDDIVELQVLMSGSYEEEL